MFNRVIRTFVKLPLLEDVVQLCPHSLLFTIFISTNNSLAKNSVMFWLFLLVFPSARVHALSFNLTPSDAIRQIGSSFKLNCQIDDKNYDNMFFFKFLPGHGFNLMAYSYQAGYVDQEPDFKKGFEFERPTASELKLNIQSVKVEDATTYFCSARYGHTEAVVCGLTIDQSPSDMTVHPGHSNLRLNCSMSGMGSYTMLWYRQRGYGAAVEFLMKEHESPTEHFEVSLVKESFSLQISNVTREDSGTYYCAASHSAAGCVCFHTRSFCLLLCEERSHVTHQAQLPFPLLKHGKQERGAVS
ncbi:limbic system-associated membrane protein-like [Alosa pseudoharengus]|uniref:limbic system-associated membrane protein-like n=1 Tax=Alosa pseudoharengus TaxID=34774 RepID=UPI003F8922C1